MNHINNYDYDFEIFADGSKCETNFGSAFCVYNNNTEIFSEKYRIGAFCSVFQAELIAIKKSIEFINTVTEREISINNKSIVLILSDLQNAISAIKQTNNSNPLVFKIKNLIKSSENRINFNIKWIRGHSGIIGNEREDTMAKEGSSLVISESIYNLFPLSFTKRH